MNSESRYAKEIDNFINNVNNGCFNNVRILINIIDGQDNKYKVNDIAIIDDKSDNCNLLNDLKYKIKKLNEKIKNSGFNWNIFYLYKELIQILKELGFNYFRGQNDKWELVPSILRYKLYKDDVSQKFELKYKKISERFEDIKYYDLEQLKNTKTKRDEVSFFEKRNTELGILQHYGFPTPLLDITQNPYVALLFMCSDSHNNNGSKRFDAFNIDEEKHSENNIFSLSYIDRRNKRINVQRGEFLDFSKFQELNSKKIKIKKIDHVTIVIQYNVISGFDEYLSKYLDLVLDSRPINDEKIQSKISEIEDRYNFNIFDRKKVVSIIKSENSDTKIAFIQFLYSSIKKYISSGIYKYVNEDLKNKLNEFEYRESDLYPDMEKQLEYMERKYTKD